MSAQTVIAFRVEVRLDDNANERAYETVKDWLADHADDIAAGLNDAAVDAVSRTYPHILKDRRDRVPDDLFELLDVRVTEAR